MSLIDKLKNIGTLGGFGDIVFTVNPFKIMNFDDAEHKSSVDYAEHRTVGRKPKLEYQNPNADEVSLNVTLASFLGLNPKEQLKKFEEYMLDGDVFDLILGNGLMESNVLGEFVIESLSRSYKEVSFLGDVTNIKLGVKFKEYN
ncbi:MAG: phage tail protein [Neisseriales bacterium]|jgi:phage protein U|nr:MAG: phage tail protein [Neisseriales bacterium]